MAVVKEFRCAVHGNFESSDEVPLCPRGCDTVARIFLTPPAVFRSNRTKNIDSTVQRLADNFGLTDMNNRGGQPSSRPNPAFARSQAELTEYINHRYPTWGRVPAGARMNAKTQQIERVEGRNGSGALGALAEQHCAPENHVPHGNPGDLALGVSPVPIKAIKDPQNLQLGNARINEVAHQRSSA